MSGEALKKLNIDGVVEVWFRSGHPEPDGEPQVYRPAMLTECTINFRSLRAGLNHSEERSYTAWLPENDMAIDWDSPAVTVTGSQGLSLRPDLQLGYSQGDYRITGAEFEQYESELVSMLVRKERLRIFFNPVFGLFSDPGDPLEDFLARVAEAALGRVEPELKSLRNRFELHLEQVREAHSARGEQAENLSFERFISHKLHFFESENRLAAMFSTLAGAVFGTTEPRPALPYKADETELREDLDRVEQEAGESLRALYSEYLSLANEYDVFEIGLQPSNIQVTRSALLWVPVSSSH